jgi:hypothetical protein
MFQCAEAVGKNGDMRPTIKGNEKATIRLNGRMSGKGKPLERFKKTVAGNDGAVFSLTPALSRREREKRSQRFGKTSVGFSL